ncbi:MAG: type IV toxin-antitoxin system AbiEi family antitoxin domain-containing protein, partial [Solirubrobacterales bacterium]
MGRKRREIPAFRIPPSTDLRLAAVAGRQYGVISLDQLRALGLSRSAVQDRAYSGRLHRIHHCTYSLVPLTLLGRDGRAMAAVLACGPGAVLSHRSAAALHGIRATARTNIDVTIPGRSPRKHAG